MPRREFEQVVASAPREVVKNQTINAPDPIAVAGVELTNVYSAPNTIGTVQSAYANAPVVPTSISGTQTLRLTNTVGSGDYTQGISVFGSIVNYNYGGWQVADNKQIPVDAGSQNIFGRCFDDTVGFQFLYVNNTDKPQTSGRTYKLTWVERQRG